jgi:RNA polymerase sigma-70 factor (ECF subfamily)
VANEASNTRRSAGRRTNLALRLAAAEGPASVDAAPSPEAAALAALERRGLLDALNRLREADRLVIGYRFLLGLSDAEAAEVLGWPIGTVKSRGARALRKLRALMPPDGTRAGAVEGGHA